MIRSLRRKFIAVTMLSVILVLILLMGIINIANYRNTDESLSQRLAMLEENGGDLSAQIERREFLEPAPDDFKGKLSDESFFDTRYFTVSVNAAGEICAINVANIATTSGDEAVDMALALYADGRTDGYRGEYKYRAHTITDADGSTVTMYIFLNASRELASFRTFLYASLAVSAVGTLLILLFVVILSKIVVRPVAESYEKQKRFITDASHEIKTPLAIIDANTEVIEMENGESEWTKSIKNQIARLTSLTEKLVFLSRMDEEGTRLTMIDFDLSEVIRDVTDGFAASAAASGRTLSLAVDEHLILHGDKAMITQLVSLLLDNAMKYALSPSEVRLTVEAYHKGKYTVRIIEENEAEELTAGNLDVLFERFYRSDPSRNSKTGGHGIGLSVAAAIVRAHGGSIHAESTDGKTIRFTVRL